MSEPPLPEKPTTKVDGKGKEPHKFVYLQVQHDRTGDGTGRVATLMGGRGSNAPAHFIPLTSKINSINMSGFRTARTQSGSVVNLGGRGSSGVVSGSRGGVPVNITSPRVSPTSVTTLTAKPTPSPAIVRKPHSSVVVSSGVVRPALSPSSTTITVLGSGGNSTSGVSLPLTPTGGGGGNNPPPILRPATSPHHHTTTSPQTHPPVILHTSKVPGASSTSQGGKNMSPRLVPMPLTQVRTGVANKAVLSYSSLLQAGGGGGGGNVGSVRSSGVSNVSSGRSGGINKKDSHLNSPHQPPLLLQAAPPSTVKGASALAKASGATISIITGKQGTKASGGNGGGGGVGVGGNGPAVNPVNMLSVSLAQTNKSNMINFKISNGQIQTENIPQVDAPQPVLKIPEPLVLAPAARVPSPPRSHSPIMELNPLSNLKDVTVIAKRRVNEDILQRAMNSLGGLEDEVHNGEDMSHSEHYECVRVPAPMMVVEEEEVEEEEEEEEEEDRRLDGDILMVNNDVGHRDAPPQTLFVKHNIPTHTSTIPHTQENRTPGGVLDNPLKTNSNFKDPALPGRPKIVEEDVKTEMVKFSDLLKWEDGVGKLDGSVLKFKINEFDAVEIVEDKDLEDLKSQQVKRIDGPARHHHSRKPNYREYIKDEDIFSDNSQDSETQQGNKSAREPDNICCCKNCGCYGLSSEFVRDSSFCSVACGDEHDAREIEWGKERLKQEKERQRRKRLREKAEGEQEGGQRSEAEEGSDEDSKETELQKFQHPWQDGRNNFSWVRYLEHCGRAKGLAKAAPLKIWPEPFPFGRNLFKAGMKLEAIDPSHQSLICVMTIAEVIGYRLRLHFDGYSDQYDFWTQADSADIFPAGWCEKNGRQLEPPMGVIGFSWKAYIEHCKSQTAPRQAFINRGNSTAILPNNFRVGMKLEAEDRKNMWVCVATVADILDNRVLIHFDGWDKVYDVWNEVSSPYIHPVGWCAENGIVLHPPNNYPSPESFNWHEYLQETNSMAVPARAFKTRAPREFKKNMKVEVVDKRNPALIRVATISEVQDYQVKGHFDGWGDEYDYWLDDDSQDIHPPSWCSKTGHALQQPLTPEQQAEDVDSGMGCGTPGCKGVGHIKGPIYTTHHTAYGCPYSLQNLNKDLESIIPDRLQYPTEKKKSRVSSKVKLDLRPNSSSKDGSEHDEADGQKKRVRKRRKFFDELTPPEPIRLQKMPKLSNDDMKMGVQASLGLQTPPTSGISSVIMSSGSLTPSTSSQPSLNQISQQPNQIGLPTPSPSQVNPQPADPGVDMMVHQSVFNPGYNPHPIPPMPHSWDRHRHLTVALGDAKKSEVEVWNPEQVRDLVARIPGCDSVAAVFVEQQIDGEALLMMTQNDLVTLLHIKLGPAIKIMAVILCLRNSP